MTRRLVGGLSVALLLVLAAASAAGAHAELTSTSPSSGATVTDSPEELVLEFTEPVETSLGGVELFDADAEQIDTGDVRREGDGGRVLVVPIEPLADGSYVVTYRVVSADAHPIEGAFTFRVGEGAAGADADALAADLLAAEGIDDTASGLYAGVRAAVFVGLAMFVGLLSFIVVVWPGAAGIRPTRRLLWVGWAVLAGSTVLAISLQGVTAAARPLADVVDPSVIGDVIDTRFGQLALARLVLLVVAIPLLIALPRSEDGQLPVWWRPAAVVGGLGILVTVAYAGHAGAGRWIPLAVAADVVHLAAMCLWFGGLVGLLGVVLPRRHADELRAVVPRFSTLAFGAVVALVVTGSVQAYRQVGSVDALTSTTYGRLLLLKLGLVAVIVALGALSRVVVRRSYGHAVAVSAGPGAMVTERDVDDVPKLERSVTGEIIIGVAVLVVTALLMNVVPGVDALEESWSAELHTAELRIDVTVDPAATGPTEIHVYTLSHIGQAVDVEDVFVDLTLPADDIGPLEVPLEEAGTGHFTTSDFDIPIAGEWTMDVRVLVTEIDVAKAEAVVPVD